MIKNLSLSLSLSSLFLITVGLLLIAYGGWSVYKYRDYTWAAGLISLGVGNLLFGVTNGFADLTPRGRVFTKVGIVSLIFGVLVVGYVLF